MHDACLVLAPFLPPPTTSIWRRAKSIKRFFGLSSLINTVQANRFILRVIISDESVGCAASPPSCLNNLCPGEQASFASTSTVYSSFPRSSFLSLHHYPRRIDADPPSLLSILKPACNRESRER